MTDQELRRALSQGPFTELLGQLTKDDLVERAFKGCKGLSRDSKEQLILRYFQYHECPPGTSFGKPTLTQHALETMRHMNKVMKLWEGGISKHEELIRPLKKSLQLIHAVFGENEAFRRPVHLVRDGQVVTADKIKKVWFDQTKLRDPIWDCTVAAFASQDVIANEKAVMLKSSQIRERLLDLMQTNSLFTDKLRSADIGAEPGFSSLKYLLLSKVVNRRTPSE